MTADLATLRVAGVNFAGWTSVEIVRSIENAASSFRFEATARYPGEANPLRIRPGDACEVYIDADRLIRGWVDSVAPAIDANSHKISVAGRSKTGDLVDCAAAPDTGDAKRFQNRKLERIAAELSAVYGVEVVAEVSTGAAMARHAVERGESVYESIERMARLRQLLICDDTAGRLVLTRAGSVRAAVDLVHGVNVLGGESRADASKVFSSYRVKGARTGDDQDFGDVVAQITGEASDPDVTRRRVLVLNAESHCTTAQAKARAQWEAATRLGQSVEATLRVQGWRQKPGGALWAPNLLVGVAHEPLGLSGDFLIADVTYRLDDGGTVAELRIGPPAAWLPEPIKAGKGGGRGGSGLWKEIAKGVRVPAKAAP